MKMAALELTAVQAYAQLHIAGLHTALMATIDYKGFRVVAVVVLPITDKVGVRKRAPVMFLFNRSTVARVQSFARNG